MARISGPFKIKGSFGNLRAYHDGDIDDDILSTKRGKNSKNHNNVMMVGLNSEFKALNVWTKIIRRITLDLVYLKKGRLNGKLVSIAKKIQSMDVIGALGFRKIESSKFNLPLIGFCMNNAHPFGEVCNIDPEISISEDRSSLTFKLMNFVSFGKFKWSEHIQYYRIYIVLAELPDIEWNVMNKAFLPVYLYETLGRKTVVSEWIPVGTEPGDIVIPVAFDENHLPREKTTVMAVVGFEFASGIQFDAPYIVTDHGTCAILGCF
jgi:hypothetical protein